MIQRIQTVYLFLGALVLGAMGFFDAPWSGRAAAQFDYSHRLMRWMDTYLAADASRDDPMPEFDLGLGELLGEGEDDTGEQADMD